MNPFDPGNVGHESEGIGVEVKGTAIETRPHCGADADQVTFESGVRELTIVIEDRVVAAVGGVKRLPQGGDDGSLVLLHQIPQYQVDRYTARLDLRDRLRTVVRPVQDPIDVGGGQQDAAGEAAAVTQLRA